MKGKIKIAIYNSELQEELLFHLICPSVLEKYKNEREDKNSNTYFSNPYTILSYLHSSTGDNLDLAGNVLCLESSMNCNMHFLYLSFVKEIQTAFTDDSLTMDNFFKVQDK